MSLDGAVTVTVEITNTGDRAGQEIVQMYVGDRKSSLPRPLKELKGFRKVQLAPGESTEVSFTVDREDLSFFDPDRHEWVAEPGVKAVLIRDYKKMADKLGIGLRQYQRIEAGVTIGTVELWD